MARSRRVAPVRLAAGHKFCFHCSTAKPYADFATDRAKWDGLRPMCRDCDNERRNAHHAMKAGKPVGIRATD